MECINNMLTIDEFKLKFYGLRGKTIAIVYIFENDNESGFNHFFIWKGKILTQWINAVYEINCIPLIIDVRTFVDKAINNSLPHIDYVLNLNSGTLELSTMALIPSTCSSINIPCIPCNAVAIVTGEDKRLSNYIANAIGLNLPRELKNTNEKGGIFRPINLGNSVGVVRDSNSDFTDGIYQEFIPGYDITTPIVYNPITQKMDFLPTIMFLPNEQDKNWFYGEKEKLSRSGYTMKVVIIDEKIQKSYLDLIKPLSIHTFCRIDARVKNEIDGYYHSSKHNSISFEDNYFIEINVMPTIRDKNSFLFSYNSIDATNSFFGYIDVLKELVDTPNINNFLLTSALASFD